jgi:hypothetical protein
MGVLAHYVPLAIAGGGSLGRHPDHAVEGATWTWDFIGLVDGNGALIPQATIATFTCVCKIRTPRGTVLATGAFAATGPGAFSITFDESITAGLAAASNRYRTCRWSMTLSDGTDVVQFWRVGNSPFTILPAETV